MDIQAIVSFCEYSSNSPQLIHARITTNGSSTYTIDSKTVTLAAYTAALATHNILTRARNFLVFQGDVEHIAQQSPKDLARLIEQISGSLELAVDYENAKKAVEKATETATESFNKRRGLAGEIKVFKEQLSEAKRFDGLLGKKDGLIVKRLVWKLYHIEHQLKENSDSITKSNKTLTNLRKEYGTHEKVLDDARAKQAKARSNVTAADKKLKKAEKALEGRKPDLVAADQKIAHAQRKLRNHENTRDAAAKDAKKQEDRLKSLRRDLQAETKAADAARGKYVQSHFW